eukprot:NODE_10322_length_290_cov_22.348548_g8554_i0.p3 GENE.NODE_10322_length_290_cov_22.348548_g8554_i0~~NODE_10322_length_290_cov_22.348548_g8554_i0.p3  ORF type:complete len:84 (+),score=23.00 NODE_10322_length_290_cov_22.348548_g8554_i0:24-254(+)
MGAGHGYDEGWDGWDEGPPAGPPAHHANPGLPPSRRQVVLGSPERERTYRTPARTGIGTDGRAGKQNSSRDQWTAY